MTYLPRLMKISELFEALGKEGVDDLLTLSMVCHPDCPRVEIDGEIYIDIPRTYVWQQKLSMKDTSIKDNKKQNLRTNEL